MASARARIVVLLVLLAGCGTTPSELPGPTSAAPSQPVSTSSPGAEIPAWREARVEQPKPVTADPSNPGTGCSPCHPPVITRMRDVAVLPGGGLVAIGTAAPGGSLVWASEGGEQWSIVPDLPDQPDTGLAAVAAGAHGVVAVGTRAGRPVAWFSPDGHAWQPGSILGASAAAGMTTVVPFGDGFVAGGGFGSAFGADRAAAFWFSADGRRWQPVDDMPALHAGHVWGLAATAGQLVAVGSAGDPQRGPSVSWSSRDGRSWRRSPPDAGLDAAVMLAVTDSPSGGFVAVGRTAGDGSDRAATWSSADGLHWTPAPATPDLESDTDYAAHAEMTDVLRIGETLVAVGWVSSSANGTGVAWSSPDGTEWARLPTASSLPGGGMAAVTVLDGQLVAVGSTGWPDTHAADAWLR